MRALPIDTMNIRLLATGSVQPVAVWAETADGSRRPVPDVQATDEDTQTPLWTVEVIAPPAAEGERAEILQVRVAANDQPKVHEFQPVNFAGLMCRVSVNRRTGQLSQYWSAAAVLDKPAARPAAQAA